MVRLLDIAMTNYSDSATDIQPAAMLYKPAAREASESVPSGQDQ